MYSACLFCSAPLGANEAIEHFPIGRRLAFDAAKGRLWVVCPRCERWNLTPLEERWEAIEECERLFRETRLRVSTAHIGLARLREGLELVRIGEPQRPEIAAWRYGDQFGRRRRRQIMGMGAFVAAGGVVVGGGLAMGLGVVVAWKVGETWWQFAKHGNPSQVAGRIRDANGTVHRILRRDLLKSRLREGSDGRLAINIAHNTGVMGREGVIKLEGDAARQAAAVLMPAVNRARGTSDDVQQAAGRLDRAGSAEQFLKDQARRGAKLTRFVSREEASTYADQGDVAWTAGLLALSAPASLALEMALHEEQERRALDGELAELERAWRDAEEIGAIADSLLLPAGIESALARIRTRVRPDAP
ncbi:MAG: hypothetical protein ABIY52_18695 [Gemmatimonadaceae bacterium]